MSDMPKVGEIRPIWLPGGIQRRGQIIDIDSHGEEVLVAWLDYPLPNEWIPIQWSH